MASDAPLNGLSLIKDGWFMERNSQWPGIAQTLEVVKVLHHEMTDFQDLLVFESTQWGKVLVLDGVIQMSERDECSYQEMLTHLPMFAHENPKQVLIIGGGDGGVLREVVKHSMVEKATMCEIDKGVVEASKKFLPKQCLGFGHPKSELRIGDGLAFAKETPDNTFDVIIVDSSDPVGPAAGLFSKEFYDNAHRILKPGGIIATQGESLWIHQELLETVVKENLGNFDSAEYASIQVPTYPSGMIGIFLGRKSYGTGKASSCRNAGRPVPADMELNYYTAEMHTAAFALPAFLLKKLRAIRPQDGARLQWNAASQ